MLNELLVVERGLRQAGIETVPLHPDVMDTGRLPTLLVRLDASGHVAAVKPVPENARPWTFRDGKQNSFPFVQPKAPLWKVSDADHDLRVIASNRKDSGRRQALLDLAEKADFDSEALRNWLGTGLLSRLGERRGQVADLEGTEAAVVPITIERFLQACDPGKGGDPLRLLGELISAVTMELQQTAQNHWLEIASALLIGKFDKKKGCWVGAGALLFDADGASMSIVDGRLAARVSWAMRQAGGVGSDAGRLGRCGLTGREGKLLSGNSPQPNLRVLGPTYLFSKNKEIPANDRYGRFATEAMPFGQDIAERLDAALRALTADDRRGITWRAIPSEASSQGDLLLAFVKAGPDLPLAAVFAQGPEDDLSEEASTAVTDTAGSVAEFEKRTERIVESIKAKVGADFRQTPACLAVFRKVDPANRKVVYSGAPTIGELYDAAREWASGERNFPPWLTLPSSSKGGIKPHPVAPPHVPPLGVIAFSKQLFVRQGTERQEIVGLPAAEALALFLDNFKFTSARRQAGRVLRMLLNRRSSLIAGTAHSLRRPPGSTKAFDRREALRTVTMMGVLLLKLGLKKEKYMNDAAFKLGQLLAAADLVHAGYCADVRGGSVPPSLLGNQVFTMAQTTPARALAMLCRRWKPYAGWAKKAARERGTSSLITSKKEHERRRGWDIRVALRHAREVAPLADELSQSLPGSVVDDTFRAELLLGYLAGLPKSERKADDDGNEAAETAAEKE